MSISGSEKIALTAKGAQNIWFTNAYVEKSTWDDQITDYCYNFENDTSSIYNDDDYEIYESEPYLYKSNNRFCHIIKFDHVLISDLRIKIKLNQYYLEEKDKDKLLDLTLYFDTGGSCVNMLSMNNNLLLAHILGKKKKEYDTTIELPIIFFDMEKNYFDGKFPLFLARYHEIRIHVYDYADIIKNGVIFQYRRYKMNHVSNTEKICLQSMIIQSQYTGRDDFRGIDAKYKLYFNHICKLLIINFFKINSLESGVLQVKLSLDGADPIIWDDDEIIKCTLFGNTYYIISLSPESKSKKSIWKLFSNKVAGYGINFSRIDRAEISFEFSSSAFHCEHIQVTALNLNIMRYFSGQVGTAYSN